MERAISVISIAENGEPKHAVFQLLLAEYACFELVIFVPVHTLQAKRGKMRTVFAQQALVTVTYCASNIVMKVFS